MADGSDRPIELVGPGDRVLGGDGKINRVRGILRPVLGDWQPYAVKLGYYSGSDATEPRIMATKRTRFLVRSE